ncbi:MAG: hypothetical protein COB04_03085 [Gammaproteobacteria bacterium]|nr:MAG: hypothetical protein COB04_03085 [Gammaproteobacteria bacterium]
MRGRGGSAIGWGGVIMIGDGHAYLDTGYSILEEGGVDSVTLIFNVQRYLVVDPGGETIANAATLALAQAFLKDYLKSVDNKGG